jgi:hypothetical protein
MSKKVYRLIVGVSGGIAAVAVAVVSYLEPAYCAAINASIAVVEAGISEICSFFVKEE